VFGLHRVLHGGAGPGRRRGLSAAATFTILHAGYVTDDTVAGTVSLIIDGESRLVVDPGMARGPDAILAPLAELGVEPEGVTHVLLTHHHPDHTLNTALFPNAEVVDFWARYRGDVWLDHLGEGHRPSSHVSLLLTPGHTNEDATWLAETDDGVVAFTHAWWRGDRSPEIDPLADDQGALETSRRRILASADIVVPAHGEPFHTNRRPPQEDR
jgi:glyoxylase-like metal-dependent hydrolase (beta-lactamase superfamily II)